VKDRDELEDPQAEIHYEEGEAVRQLGGMSWSLSGCWKLGCPLGGGDRRFVEKAESVIIDERRLPSLEPGCFGLQVAVGDSAPAGFRLDG
jgi:hypothetical protein